MKRCLIALMLFIAGCKKNHDPLDNYVNNNISITVSSATGPIGTFNYHGELAPMMHSFFYEKKFYGKGKTSSTDEELSFGQASNDPTGMLVFCSFHAANGGTYLTPTTNPGTINFTKHTDTEAAGSFTAKCGYGSDTLTISGTFSGHCN